MRNNLAELVKKLKREKNVKEDYSKDESSHAKADCWGKAERYCKGDEPKPKHNK